MKVTKTSLDGILILEPRLFADSRGFFFESFNVEKYREAGIASDFLQDNVSRSTKNVVRGLHFQIGKPQAKLVSVLRGVVYDVAVDLRKNSPTFGQYVGQILSDENHLQMYIPEGFAHGFCVLSDYADFHYKCTDYYYPEGERGIVWDDQVLNIAWPIDKSLAIVSDKDKLLPAFDSISL